MLVSSLMLIIEQRSNRRAEYPVSLSYHETNLIKLPSTLVNSLSIIEDSFLPTISIETNGSELTDIIPCIDVLDADCSTLLTSSTDVYLSVIHTKSVIEPQATGTRKAIPSNLPFKLGNTLPTADAAPVFVGIIEFIAERALLKSL